MKKLIFAAILTCLSLNSEAQVNQQPDSTPPAQGWMQLASGTTAGFDQITLVGRDTVYVTGEKMLRSTDGGATWETPANFPAGGRIAFFDAMTGIRVGLADTAWITKDGGQTWQPHATGATPFGADQIVLKDHGCWIRYNDRVIQTYDTGATWSGGLSTGSPYLNTMAFVNMGDGIVMGHQNYWLFPYSTFAAACSRTTDSGRTWFDSYDGATKDGQHTGVFQGVEGVTIINSDTFFAAGDYGLIARSIDGGQNWDSIPGPQPLHHYQGICFADKFHGTIVGSNGTIIHTDNGGSNWVPQNSGISPGPFWDSGPYLNAVIFTDSLTGYVAGDSGIILKTINGGLSWVNVSPPLGNLINAMSYPQPANEQVTISYNLPAAQHITISVNDLSGANQLRVLLGALQQPGIKNVEINTGNLTSGTYVYVLQSEKYYSTGKIQVIH